MPYPIDPDIVQIAYLVNGEPGPFQLRKAAGSAVLARGYDETASAFQVLFGATSEPSPDEENWYRARTALQGPDRCQMIRLVTTCRMCCGTCRRAAYESRLAYRFHQVSLAQDAVGEPHELAL